MPNLVGLTNSQWLDALVAVYPKSHPVGDDDGSDQSATVVSQDPAAGTALSPEDGPVTLHMSDAAQNPLPSASGDDTSDSSYGSGTDHHIPHPHVHVCVGGKHVHVCG